MITLSYSRPTASFEDFDPGSSHPLDESGWFIRRELRHISDRWSIKPDLPKKGSYVKKEDRTPLYDAWQNVFNRNAFHPEDIQTLYHEGTAVMMALCDQHDAAIGELISILKDKGDHTDRQIRGLISFLREVCEHVEGDMHKWQDHLRSLLDQMRDNPDLWENAA